MRATAVLQREENKENTSGNAAAPVQESILQMKQELFERSKQLKTAISGIQLRSPLDR